MEDIKKSLLEFKNRSEAIEGYQFPNFHELEVGYCNLINEGSKIRTFILSNPSGYDENVIKYLKNEINDAELLPKDFRPLEYFIKLKSALISKYQDYSKILIDEKKFEEAITIYNQLFKFTGQYIFIQNIADTYLKGIKDTQKSLEIYKDIEKYLDKTAHYHWGISRVYEEIEDYYLSLLHIKKAIDIELLEGKNV